MISVPDHIQELTDRLETAGFAAYAVGGCIRDMLLGLEPHDYDLCTSALPEQTRAVFSDHRLVLAGLKHGTVSVLTEKDMVEITTFRQEGDYQDSRHPGWVRFVPRVEDDLARRDFTVNAMAWSKKRGFSDPFGGRRDLEAHILRAVGDPRRRFREDALRILRGVRFSVRFRLEPEEQTLAAMTDLVPLTDKLARERVFDELCKLLPLVEAADLIRFAPILGRVLPPLAPAIGFSQHSPHHAYDVFTHTAHVTAAVPPDLPLRWAALLHDIGKIPTFTLDDGGQGHFLEHARVGAAMADDLLLTLHAPTALRERVVWLILHHMTPLEPDKKLLRRRLSRWGVEQTHQLLALQRADFCAKGVSGSQDGHWFDDISALLAELEQEQALPTLKTLAVNGRDLLALGFPAGKHLGNCLEALLEQVLQETLPNEKQALLDAASRYLADAE